MSHEFRNGDASNIVRRLENFSIDDIGVFDPLGEVGKEDANAAFFHGIDDVVVGKGIVSNVDFARDADGWDLSIGFDAGKGLGGALNDFCHAE